MPDEPAALFVPDGAARYVATAHTRGPWSPDAQHGGPGCALLAGAVEDPEAGRRVVRLTVELLRPLPIGVPLALEVDPPEGGRAADRVAARLRDPAGTVLAAALALRIRRKPVEVPEPAAEPTPGSPGSAHAVPMPGGGGDRLPTFFDTGIEVRFSRGTFLEAGPATAWFRLRVPVVLGQPITPLQRAAAAADFGNGISGLADMRRLLYVNPDLTLALHREPAGEWVALESESRLQSDGIGGADSALWDEQGRIGRGYQTLLVAAR